MKIIYVKGNLLEAPEKYILHGCNAQGVMGSGVAKAIRNKWPEAYHVYIASKSEGGMKLGTVTFASTGVAQDSKVVFNAITQEFFGSDGSQYVSYEAIKDCIERIDWYLSTLPTVSTERVALPKIGAGFGGGDWDIISKIIEDTSIHFQPVVYEL